MIVADTSAIVALLDASSDQHRVLRDLHDDNPAAWTLPWAILPEVDYLVAKHLGAKVRGAFLGDLADGTFVVEWGRDEDLAAARRLDNRYKSLQLGLVDAVVIAMAERLKAEAIATLDLRHFGAVSIKGDPRLLPRDR
jgi:predicted nucleic acid-binding protein